RLVALVEAGEELLKGTDRQGSPEREEDVVSKERAHDLSYEGSRAPDELGIGQGTEVRAARTESGHVRLGDRQLGGVLDAQTPLERLCQTLGEIWSLIAGLGNIRRDPGLGTEPQVIHRPGRQARGAFPEDAKRRAVQVGVGPGSTEKDALGVRKLGVLEGTEPDVRVAKAHLQ